MTVTKITDIQAKAIAVRGADIDTDRIIPARFLKEITFSKMGNYPFFDERFTETGEKKDHPFNKEDHQGAGILLSNENFGCGSSREHAPQSLNRWGIQAIIAESYAEIFAGNCVMLGMPAFTASVEDLAKMQEICEKTPETIFKISLEKKIVTAGTESFKLNIPDSRRNALLEGTWDSTALLLANAEKTAKTAKNLAYTSDFA